MEQIVFCHIVNVIGRSAGDLQNSEENCRP